MHSASSITSRSSQLRRAPSDSNGGAATAAIDKQLSTASSAPSRPFSTRLATKYSNPRYRVRRGSRVGCSSSEIAVITSPHFLRGYSAHCPALPPLGRGGWHDHGNAATIL